MKRLLNAVKILLVVISVILVVAILFVRLSRYSDRMIYQTNGLDYDVFKTTLNHEEFYFDTPEKSKLHGVLFKPDTLAPLATIFHYPGKGMHLMSSIKYYEALLESGFQIFSFERRDFGKSTGEALNTLILKADALRIFDKVTKQKQVQNTPIIIWGQSLGGAFATMNAAERSDKIEGLILEGTFNSFVGIGRVYARALHLENLKFLVPILMNNDFPAENEIKRVNKPTLIIHSREDLEVPFYLGEKLYEASNKETTEFWKIEGKHVKAIFDYEEEYVSKFKKLLK